MAQQETPEGAAAVPLLAVGSGEWQQSLCSGGDACSPREAAAAEREAQQPQLPMPQQRAELSDGQLREMHRLQVQLRLENEEYTPNPRYALNPRYKS